MERSLQQGVRRGREPMVAALPDLAPWVCDGGNTFVAVGLHHHVRVAALRSNNS